VKHRDNLTFYFTYNYGREIKVELEGKMCDEVSAIVTMLLLFLHPVEQYTMDAGNITEIMVLYFLFHCFPSSRFVYHFYYDNIDVHIFNLVTITNNRVV
jgi:hypothetical protein